MNIKSKVKFMRNVTVHYRIVKKYQYPAKTSMLLHDSQFDMYNMKCTLGIHGKKAPQENKRKTNQVANTLYYPTTTHA